jgi:superfamily II DNA or RNA helicase
VVFDPPRIEHVVGTNLAQFHGDLDVDSLLDQGIFAGHDAFSRLMTFTKLSNPLSDTLYAFLASRTNLYPYQYKPLLKFLESSNHRLLIADEVGLGKTIEAGLILIEHRARASLDRVLVVCTSSLRAKWQDELQRRFDEHFRVLDGKGFRELLDDVAKRGTAATFRAIVSYGSVRSPEVLSRLELESPPLDLLVVDEAHHVRNPTLASRAIAALSDASDAVLFLTATPVHLGNENLFALLRLLDSEQFDRFDVFQQRMEANTHVVRAGRELLAERPPDPTRVEKTLRAVENSSERERFLSNPLYTEVLGDLQKLDLSEADAVVNLHGKLTDLNFLSRILSRSRKAEVQPDRPKRVPQVVRFRFTPLEMEIYESATTYARDTWHRAGAGSVQSLGAIMRQRQVASSVPAALQHFRNNATLHAVTQVTPELSDLDSDEWSEFEVASESDQSQSFTTYYSKIQELEQHDSKFSHLAEALRALDRNEPGRKKIIFSYFKATLYYLERRLDALGMKTLVLTGDVPSRPDDPERDERAKLLDRFRSDPTVQILLSSEVGSEGLDFQFCSVLINYDLPWNPMVVEQRIGRLDRIGQRSQRITILTLSVQDTIEDRILERLYVRIGIFKDSIGDLEAILGDIANKLQADLLLSTLSPKEQERLIDEKALVLAREQSDARQLERRSGELLGHDEFFATQLDRTQRLRLYITARELEVFLRQYLGQHFPDAAVTYNWSRHEGTLTTPDALILAVRRHAASSDPLLRLFLQRTLRGECRFTLDSQRANEDPSLEFITGHHPLIQSIVAHYRIARSELHPVSIVRIAATDVTPGSYFYSVELTQASGVRPRLYLETTFVSIASSEVLPPDQSRQLLGKVIEEGSDASRDTLGVSLEHAMRARSVALEAVGQRIKERSEELGRANERLADAQLASLKASYEARQRQKTAMLEQARARGREARYTRMLEGTLRNMRTEYETKVAKVNSTRAFDVSFSTVAAGLVSIITPD